MKRLLLIVALTLSLASCTSQLREYDVVLLDGSTVVVKAVGCGTYDQDKTLNVPYLTVICRGVDGVIVFNGIAQYTLLHTEPE